MSDDGTIPATFIGGDPGLDGALVLISAQNTVLASVRLKTLIGNPCQLFKLIEEWTDNHHPEMVALEKIPKGHPGQRRGINSALTMGINWGALHMALSACGHVPFTPLPKAWQKEILKGIKGDTPKEKSVRYCTEYIPTLDMRPGNCKNPHNGLSDAACLAVYAGMQYV